MFLIQHVGTPPPVHLQFSVSVLLVHFFTLYYCLFALQVRHVAVSNENAYGVTKFCHHADWDNLPRIVSVQAQYNLVSQIKVERCETWTMRFWFLLFHARTSFSFSSVVPSLGLG